jgi:uracil-DNA glycosylase family 4
MNPLREMIDCTIQELERMKRQGITHVAVSRDTLQALGAPVPAPKRARSTPAPSAVPATSGVSDVPVKSAAPVPTRGPMPPLPEGDVDTALAVVQARAKECVQCSELAACRHNVVFGVGDTRAELMFVGEAPGADEDMEGEPFVGRAGQLLTKMIQAMGYKRSEVYIANILKCRPPNNRPPLPEEMERCLPFLRQQIALIRPKTMVCLGATAVRGLLGLEQPISKVRGNWHLFDGIPVMPTFHPAYLLRNPSAKREVWQDLQVVMAKLGRPAPKP